MNINSNQVKNGGCEIGHKHELIGHSSLPADAWTRHNQRHAQAAFVGVKLIISQRRGGNCGVAGADGIPRVTFTQGFIVGVVSHDIEPGGKCRSTIR